MARTAIATLQPVWDCRWSRLRYEAVENVRSWICVYEGQQRPVTEDECATCPHWEMSPAAAADAVVAPERVELTPAVARWRRPLMQAVILLNALVFLASGFVILTSPLMIPLTIALWMCAAGLTGYAIAGRLPT